MANYKKYFAFISYKSEDVEWATWIQHELEHYHLPASFNGRKDMPHELRPVFRDIDELSAGNLPEQIKEALFNSQNLIVICSPDAATSPWVNQEVETFIALGRTERIFPFIVEGNKPSEFFPRALLKLPKDKERLGADVSKKGRDAAFVKVVAGMLGVSYDSLWNRYEKEKAEKERKQREQRDKLLIAQSRFLAEKANLLIDEGDFYTARLLALKALPKDLTNPDRPYVPEADAVLRKSFKSDSAILRGHHGRVLSVVANSEVNKIVSASDSTIRVWDALSGACTKILKGHLKQVRCVAFSHDGKIFASASEDKIIRIWNSSNGKCSRVLKGHTKGVTSVAFCSDGSRIISASYDFTMRIWDIQTGECIQLIDLHGRGGVVNSVAYSENGSVVASASYGSHVYTWDAFTGECLQNFVGHFEESDPFTTPEDDVNSVAFSQDGSKIVTASMDCTARIWDVATGECLHVLDPKNDFQATPVCLSAIFINDDKQVVTAHWDNVIRIWDAESGEMIKKVEGHTDAVSSVSFLSHSKRIVSSSWDHTVRIWDLEKKKDYISFEGHHFAVTSVCFDHNDKLIASASMDETVRIWDLSTRECLRILKGHGETVNSVVFSFDNSMLATASDDNTIRIWNVITGACVHVFNGHTDKVNSVVFNSDSSKIVSASDDKSIRIWDTATGDCLRVLEGHTEEVRCVALSGDGSKIVSASWDNTLRVWDSNTGICLWLKQGQFSAFSLTSAIFNHDDTIIASISCDDLLLRDAESGRVLSTLQGHNRIINALALTSDGRKIVTASDDKTAIIWDLASRCDDNQLELGKDNVTLISLNHDNSMLAALFEDKMVRVWDINTGKRILSLKGHAGNVKCVAFSHDGRKIVSGADDNTIRVWNSVTGRVLMTLKGHVGTVCAVAFKGDDTEIVSASYDNTIRIWDTETGMCLQIIEAQYGLASVAYCSDYDKLISNSEDEICIWDASTGVCLASLGDLPSSINNVSSSHNCRKVVIADYDSVIHIWNYPHLQDIIDNATELFNNRSLTQEEKRKFYIE